MKGDVKTAEGRNTLLSSNILNMKFMQRSTGSAPSSPAPESPSLDQHKDTTQAEESEFSWTVPGVSKPAYKNPASISFSDLEQPVGLAGRRRYKNGECEQIFEVEEETQEEPAPDKKKKRPLPKDSISGGGSQKKKEKPPKKKRSL